MVGIEAASQFVLELMTVLSQLASLIDVLSGDTSEICEAAELDPTGVPVRWSLVDFEHSDLWLMTAVLVRLALRSIFSRGITWGAGYGRCATSMVSLTGMMRSHFDVGEIVTGLVRVDESI